MARSIGLPTRVAVGFTPGDEDPNKPGHCTTCRGTHAHAWPEVYFPGQGWVPFEPTPTRGAPNAQQYTNVPEQQAAHGGGATTVPTTALREHHDDGGHVGNDGAPQTSSVRRTSSPTATEPSFWSTRRFGGRALIAGARAARVGDPLRDHRAARVSLLPAQTAQGSERARRTGPSCVAGECRGGTDARGRAVALGDGGRVRAPCRPIHRRGGVPRARRVWSQPPTTRPTGVDDEQAVRPSS